MKKLKGKLTTILTLALCFNLLPVVEAQSTGDFTIQNGVLVEYNGIGGNVIIPDNVTTIGDEAFSHCSQLKSVTIPSNVREIGFEAFYACTNLSNITISNGLTTIGHSAFAMCSSLVSISIPDSVVEIDQYAFWACSSLANVTGGRGLVSIGYKAFADCDNLTNIPIPSGTTITDGAFINTPIDEVDGKPTGAGLIAMLPSPPPKTIVPENISEVGYWRHNATDWALPQSEEAVFKQICSLVDRLTAGKKSETEKAKAIFDWISQNIDYDWVAYNKGGGSTSKGDAFYAFYYRIGVCGDYAILAHFMLTLVGFPVAYIAGDAGRPHAWNAVYADGHWIEFDATWGIWDMPPNYHSSTDNISFRNGIFLEVIRNDGSIDYQMWNLNEYPSEIAIPADVTDFTFNDMDELISVTIPDGTTEISVCAFEQCTSLANVVLPSSVTTIGNRAFAYCSSLTNVPITNSVTKIGNEAFSYCTGFTNVNLPGNVTEIGNAAFSHCTNLTSITIPASVTKIGASAFFSCTNLKSVMITNGNTEIGELAFSNHYYPLGYLSMPDVTIYSTAGGKVESFCSENGISFVAVTAGFTDIPDIPDNTWFSESISSESKSSQPQQLQQSATSQANPTNDKLTVNDVLQTPTVYKINDYNYFKIRDLAAALNGTSKQFAVGYDGTTNSVTAIKGQPYEIAGGELAGAAEKNKTAEISNDVIYVDGVRTEVEVYKIDGNNYFKLRDLGEALGFDVGWTAEEGVFISTED